MLSSTCKRLNKNNEMVQVVVRCRPMSDEEISNNYSCVVRIESSRNVIEIHNLKQKDSNPKRFTYDAVFDGKSSQSEIYDQVVQPLIVSVLHGYNGTVFAYGQSGSGKTYTMEGKSSKNTKGILSRTFRTIFEHVSKSCNIQYLIRASFIEIYKDEIRDLLDRKNNKKYEVRESKDSGVYIKGISSFVCKTEKEMNLIIDAGRQNRVVASTNMNERSSRSHAIVTITVEMKDLTGPLEGRVRVGKLNLVDLAGSERQYKTNAEGNRLKEANKINLSLSALGNVISALSENKNHHIPYRDSKLTRILKDSLGGNSKTLMIANISPTSNNYDESLNTLRYASRAKNIRNDPQVNEDPVDTLIRRYQEEIKILKSQLYERTMIKQCCKVKTNENEDSYVFINNLRSKTYNNLTVGNIIENITSVQEMKDQQNDEVEDLKKRIALMESRLLMGNKNILQHTAGQKKALEEQAYEINKIKQREKEMSEFIVKEKEITEEIKGEFIDLGQEVDIMKKKIINIMLKIETIQQEINDAKEEFNTDRRELEKTQLELLKEIKLKLLIMKNFIPKENRRQLLSKMYYDQDTDCWQLKQNYDLYHTLPKPKSVEGVRRPLSLYSIISQGLDRGIDSVKKAQKGEHVKDNLRFKGENILKLDLVQAPRTTKHYKSPKIPPSLRTIFQAALQLEEDIDIDAKSAFTNSSSSMNSSRRSLESMLKSNHAENPRKTQSAVNLPVYPKARGLVRK